MSSVNKIPLGKRKTKHNTTAENRQSNIWCESPKLTTFSNCRHINFRGRIALILTSLESPWWNLSLKVIHLLIARRDFELFFEKCWLADRLQRSQLSANQRRCGCNGCNGFNRQAQQPRLSFWPQTKLVRSTCSNIYLRRKKKCASGTQEKSEKSCPYMESVVAKRYVIVSYRDVNWQRGKADRDTTSGVRLCHGQVVHLAS